MSLSVQEAATIFAKELALHLNAAAAETAGIEVMWFRAIPDKRSQDVIFQSYTLFGVEDCPLTFKAIYSDAGYDDATISYNIMGIEYQVPLTLEIAKETWDKITKNDGSLPQRGDIVFIPISNKLVEVVSMSPIKSIAAQITSFKVNCSVYKPTRSRIVGENLKESIDQNTTNLYKRFGEDIQNVIDNVIDDKQLSLYNTTVKDEHKVNSRQHIDDSLITNKAVTNVISNDLIIDGHIVARTYYDMQLSNNDVCVSYNKKDTLTSDSERCYSVWINIKEHSNYTNIKALSTDVNKIGVPTGNTIYINSYSGKRLEAGTNVIIERGNIIICGIVSDSEKYSITVNPNIIKALSRSIKNWTSMTGYIIRKDNVINLLNAEGNNNSYNIQLKGNNFISVNDGINETLIQTNFKLKCGKWYALIINFGKTLSLDIFDGEPELKHLCGTNDIQTSIIKEDIYSYCIKSSNVLMTNIRLYDVYNKELDKQITDIVTYNTPYDSHAIINDSADTPLNKPYTGVQR